MKRHSSLVSLSRDHHYGLLLCWKIRQGVKLKRNNKRISDYVSHCWAHDLQPHFSAEEHILFPAKTDPLVDRAIAEHAQIHETVKAILERSESCEATLLLLADQLERHIRFEERELFVHLEATLPETTLAAIGEKLQQAHLDTANIDYTDEFWKL